MSHKTTVLPNGITVITETMPSVRSISLGLWFNVGTRDERADQAGLAHFMEHMMFKGTKSRDAYDISMQFDRLGAEYNAFTSREYTCFYARFVDDKLKAALEILADMVINSTFAQEAINTEREVVIEEIARSEDTPDDFIFDLYTSSNLPSHELGLPVLGTREAVGSYVHDNCQEFHDEYYCTGNLVLSAAGNVDHETLLALVQDLFEPMRKAPKHLRHLSVPKYGKGIFAQTRDIEQAHVVYGVPWFGIGDARRYAAGVLTTLLGGSMSSRLFQEIREQRGLAYSIYATQGFYQGAGQWCVYAGTRPGNLSEVVGLITAELTKLVEQPVPEEELNRTIDFISGQFLLGLETTNSHMVRLGKREVLGLEQISAQEQVERYKSVTAGDVQTLAVDMLTQPPTVAVVSAYTQEEVTEQLSQYV